MQLRITSRKKLTSLLCALGLISIVAIYPRQTVNFFYSTAVQITDYIHFYSYRPVKSFAIRIPASYTIHGIDVSRWQERIDWQRVAKMRDNGIRLQFAFIKATEGEKLVEINNGENDFIFLRYKKIIGVFDLKNDDLVVYNTISSLASRVSNIFGFKLELHNKYTGATTQANPACLFAPFFIDQDEGWKAVINSFENMSMYSEWKKNILYYHSGIKPKEYYTVQGKIKEIK
ncbi:GH25 family lysozyme, partial [Escherichia coli]